MYYVFCILLFFIILLNSKNIPHNRLRDVFLETCRRACIGARVDAGSGLGHGQRRTRPADVLVPDWMFSRQASRI